MSGTGLSFGDTECGYGVQSGIASSPEPRVKVLPTAGLRENLLQIPLVGKGLIDTQEDTGTWFGTCSTALGC